MVIIVTMTTKGCLLLKNELNPNHDVSPRTPHPEMSLGFGGIEKRQESVCVWVCVCVALSFSHTHTHTFQQELSDQHQALPVRLRML